MNFVLIVDDDVVARFLMMRVIKKVIQKHQILTASNGQQALTLFNQICFTDVCPVLLLLDFNMPGWF